MTVPAVCAVGILAIGLCLAGQVAAQTPPRSLGACKDQDLRGFTIRDARLEDPFWMLHWRKPDAALRSAIAALKGKPYSFEAVNVVSRQIESQVWLPDTAEPIVGVHYSDIALFDCREGQVDVVFRVFSAAASTTLSTVFEWGSKDKTPDETAGLARTHTAWQAALEASFDRAQSLAGGGRLRATWSNRRWPFGALAVRAVGSTESHEVSASLVGDSESPGSWLQRVNWRVLFSDSSIPTGSTGQDQLDDRRIGAQFSGRSRPMNGVVTRFGGILNGGQLRSGLAEDQLPAQTVPSSRFTESTLFAGVTGRQRRQSFTASYVVAFGSTGAGFRGDWRKHVADVAHELWLPVGDHRLFEVEQRLTLGHLQVLDAVPVGERFFGGAGDETLVANDDWRIPLAPRIRSIPTNRLALGGTGGDSFFAYNSTTAFTVWRRPALPSELLTEPEFNGAVRVAMTGARATLDAVYRSSDPNFQRIKNDLPTVVASLNRVAAAEAAARSSGAVPDAVFEPCSEALSASRTAADHAVADTAPQAYGWVKELLPDGDNALANVASACGVDLVGAVRTAGVATGDLESASHELSGASVTMEMRFDAIDNDKWSKRADADLAYAQRTLDVILKQLNLTAISPVFVFDAVHLGPTGADPYGGKRYAIGGGVRFTLASTVNMTLTYARNPQRLPGEGSGAVVFALTTRNLFD